MGLPLDGVVCRIMLLTSACFSTFNNITVEFSTPGSAVTNSMMFCMNDTSFALDRVILYSLIPGGGFAAHCSE